MQLLREIRLVTRKKCQAVFNYGEVGDKFYIVLHGSVSILLPKEEALFDI